LVEVDAGSIPATLFESELFGYRAGAFTGAEENLEGRVARAAGGSLLLDHVEEIPLAAQSKLLRLLAEGRYAPLGGRETEADVRFLAVAPEGLGERVRAGHFRADLFYRLEVVTFVLPPLRRRKADLPATIDHFLRDLGERFGRKDLELTSSARSWMIDHPWPGNLRQVRNVLERELVLVDDGRLDPVPPEGEGERPKSLAASECEQIQKALAYCRGHQGRAAEILGISRKALWEKRKRQGLP
jgi:two-component system C4-dicarboxylate transport response regulator DctD